MTQASFIVVKFIVNICYFFLLKRQAVLADVPLFTICFGFQRYFISGITIGTVKD